jgi:tetratricopeptide (TPR) repeat protein
MRPILKTLGIAVITAGVMNLQPLYAQNDPITNSDVESFSTSLEQSVIHGDPELLNHLIYFPEFIKRTESRSNLRDNVDTLTKIAASFGLFNIGSGILETAKNGSFSLVHRFLKNDETHLLFRVFGDGGLNYEEITLIKVKDSIKAADIFSYQLGESYAKLFSYLMEDTKSPDAHASMTSREKYGSIFENALNNKNYSAARSAFEKFDEQTQNDKHLLLRYMQACQHLGEKSFRKSVDRFITLYPEEPAPYLLMMAAYADTKEYADYGHAIDKLDTALHIDPMLNYFRGNLLMKMSDLSGALHFYELAFEYDPGIWQNTEKLVACKVVSNELVEANDAIKLYCQTPGYKKDLVESLYAAYPALK